MDMFKQTLVVFSVWILSYVWTEGNILIVTDGNYSIGPYNDDHYWLKSGPYFLHSRGHKMDTDSKKLQVSNSSYASSGIDVLGNWQDFTVHLHAERDVYMEATIRTYPNDEPNIVVFIQRFPRGLNSSRADSVNHTATGFPTFQLKSPSNDSNLAYLMFGGYMLGDRSKVFGRWTNTANLPDGLDGSGPLILYDEAGGVLLMSPMDNFMAASVWVDSGVIAWGVMGGVDSLPPGFTLRTLCYLGNDGVGQAFRDWGRVIREWYNKTDAVVQLHESRDITLTHLGYWTDNGAYYYYHTESGLNYEQTLYSVKQYAMARQLPYRYMQLDSWWYYKDSILAVTEWEAMKSVFPSGLRNLSADLQLPLAAHNRFWSVNTTYAKQNGGQFDFFIGKVLGLPTTEVIYRSPQNYFMQEFLLNGKRLVANAFWNWLFKTSRQWGLILYEQDWLNFQLLQTELLQTNLTAGADWLDSMAAAARDSNITVQYCMALSRHGLHSLKWPHITQARVTDDYHLYTDNWKIGITSHFSAALGLAPSKDTFWTTSVQSGNIYNLTEPYPDLQVAVATLSTGPVGPGDAINKTSREVLMRCCAADGVILKPSRPATAIDAMFLELGFGEGSGTSGEIWSTYSDFNDVLRFGIIFTANISRPFNITPVNVGFSPMIPQYPESILFERGFPEKLYNFSDSFQFEINNSSCNASFFCLFYTAPLITFSNKMQLVLLGELEKWVPMSPKRVLKVHLSAHSVQLLLHGQPLESVTFFYFLQDTLMQKTILIGQNGCGILCITSKEFDKDDSIYSNSAPDYCHFQLLSPNSG